MFNAGHEPTQDSAVGEGNKSIQGSAFMAGHEAAKNRACGAGRKSTQTDRCDR